MKINTLLIKQKEKNLYNIHSHSGRFKQNIIQELQRRKQLRRNKKNKQNKQNRKYQKKNIKQPQKTQKFDILIKQHPYQLSRILKMAKQQKQKSYLTSIHNNQNIIYLSSDRQKQKQKKRSSSRQYDYYKQKISTQQLSNINRKQFSYPLYSKYRYIDSILSQYHENDHLHIPLSSRSSIDKNSIFLDDLTKNSSKNSSISKNWKDTIHKQNDMFLDIHFKLEQKNLLSCNVEERVFIPKQTNYKQIRKKCQKRLYLNQKIEKNQQKIIK